MLLLFIMPKSTVTAHTYLMLLITSPQSGLFAACKCAQYVSVCRYVYIYGREA